MSRTRIDNGLHALLGVARAIPRGLSGAEPPARNRRAPSLVGIDLAPEFRIRPRRSVVVAGVACVVAALLLAGLRVDLIRKSYAIAAAVKEERGLQEEKQRLLVEMRKLRDPAGLVAQAQKLGFGNPERVVDLDATALSTAPAAVGARP